MDHHRRLQMNPIGRVLFRAASDARACAHQHKAAREPSRAACGMNCRVLPVPFITWAINELGAQQFQPNVWS
jgi:hypothetical protein